MGERINMIEGDYDFESYPDLIWRHPYIFISATAISTLLYDLFQHSCLGLSCPCAVVKNYYEKHGLVHEMMVLFVCLDTDNMRSGEDFAETAATSSVQKIRDSASLTSAGRCDN